jgi:hypothetical protein
MTKRHALYAGIASAFAIVLFLIARSASAPFPIEPATDTSEKPSRPVHRINSSFGQDQRPGRAVAARSGGAKLATGEVVVRAKWGGKIGELGRRPAEESNPEAPMSIIADGGELIVVDQVNLRVQRFKNGEPVGSFQASETVQDVARLPGGKTVLLDRLADKNVQIYGPDGKLENTVPLLGKGIDDGGRITGVFGDDKGVYVERDHTTLVRIADASGNKDDARPEIPGRPTKDGKWVVTLALTNRATGDFVLTAFDRTSFTPIWSQDSSFGAPVLHVVMVDSDRDGNLYAGADVGHESSEPPYAITDEVITVLRIKQSGAVTGRLDLPVSPTGDEMQRPMTVGDDGALYLMAPGSDGLSVIRYTF